MLGNIDIFNKSFWKYRSKVMRTLTKKLTLKKKPEKQKTIRM